MFSEDSQLLSPCAVSDIIVNLARRVKRGRFGRFIKRRGDWLDRLVSRSCK